MSVHLIKRFLLEMQDGILPDIFFLDVLTAWGWLVVTFRLCPICVMWKGDRSGSGNTPLFWKYTFEWKGRKRISIRTDPKIFSLWKRGRFSQKNLLVATARAKKWKVGTLLRISNGFQNAWDSLRFLSLKSLSLSLSFFSLWKLVSFICSWHCGLKT